MQYDNLKYVILTETKSPTHHHDKEDIAAVSEAPAGRYPWSTATPCDLVDTSRTHISTKNIATLGYCVPDGVAAKTRATARLRSQCKRACRVADDTSSEQPKLRMYCCVQEVGGMRHIAAAAAPTSGRHARHALGLHWPWHRVLLGLYAVSVVGKCCTTVRMQT